jgi:zinc protease
MSPSAARRSMLFTFGLLVTVSTTASAQSSPTVASQDVEVFELESGLQVVLRPDASTTQVAVSVSYRAGEREQPLGYRGLAALTERLMFNGSRNVAPGELHRRLERAGAVHIDSWTSADAATFSQVVPAQHLATALWLESDRMASMLARLDRRALKIARRGLVRELHEAETVSAATGLDEVIDQVLYPEGHPYRRSGAVEAEVRRLRLRHVQWFFQRHYAPRDARLALVGRFTPREARALVERYFGTIRSSHRPLRTPAVEPLGALQGRIRVVFGALTRSRTLRVIWTTPAFLTAGDAELDVAAYVFAHGRRSRLHRRLVEEMDAASAVYASQMSRELASTFRVQVQARAGADLDAMVEAIEAEVRQLCEEPLAAEELERILQMNRERELIASDSLLERAEMTSRLRSPLRDDGVFHVEDSVARYSSVTPESVQQAVCRYLPVDGRLAVLVVPWDSAPEQGMIITQESGR